MRTLLPKLFVTTAPAAAELEVGKMAVRNPAQFALDGVHWRQLAVRRLTSGGTRQKTQNSEPRFQGCLIAREGLGFPIESSLGICPHFIQNSRMFSASKITPEQKEALKQWAAEGATMSDLQRHLKEDFGHSLTYMDTRFLILDLGIELIEEAKVVPKEEEKPTLVPTGFVNTTMDTLTLPGALVSGKVTFSDGETAVWMLDQSGRPGLDPDTPGYRPAQEDILEFQKQLRELIRQSGL